MSSVDQEAKPTSQNCGNQEEAGDRRRRGGGGGEGGAAEGGFPGTDHNGAQPQQRDGPSRGS